MKRVVVLIISFIAFGQLVFGQSNEYKIKQTTENETTIKAYLDSNSVDPLEGIYKTLSGLFYKIAIKKYDDKYFAIILDAQDKKKWKVGTVKAYFEKSSVENLFSVRWLMEDKKPEEAIGRLENESILKILLSNGLYGSTEELDLLKMYPINKSETSKSENTISVTGSGFFISTKGLIATNAHVVNGAKKIEIKVANDFGYSTFKAKLVLIDTKNDVAILQVEDQSFKDLKPLPYGITDQADIGEKSFTIGFPLNDIMGINYKVTDGIVSAKSGIADDIRYYQITIPIQPGNSGGPLFNNQGNIIGITSASLNGKAIGVSVENVNYAIKAAYLENLMNMIPNTKIPSPTNELAGKELKEQVKVLKDYVCLIQVTE